MKLEIKNLCVSLQGNQILNGLDLAVREGEILALLGPSGCGKSTLLKTVAGLLPTQAGQIFLDGEEISRRPPHQRGAVIVFQDLRLFPHMCVLDNIAFPLKMQGVSRPERRARAEEMLEKVQMKDFGRRRVFQLSGGQQQRVALARALAARPRLLLLDEPFSSLDEELRQEMQQLVLGLHRECGMTTILVTHDREEAFRIADRVALLFAGRIDRIGTSNELCQTIDGGIPDRSV